MRPILFYLPFGLPIYGYGLMLFLSVVVGRMLALHLARRDGLDARQLGHACTWSLAGALVGARLLYVVTNLDQFDSFTGIFEWWRGGVVAYGGFLGGFLATLAFSRLYGIPLLAWTDCAAPALCLGLMLTRLGCFLGGCDFGLPWDGPWAIRFPAGSPAFEQQMLLGLLPAGSTESLPVHPTQIYESLAGLALLILVMASRRQRGFKGQPFVVCIVGYAVLRSAIETVRADADRGFIGVLSTSQWIAAATLVSAALLAWTSRQRRRRDPSGIQPWRPTPP